MRLIQVGLGGFGRRWMEVVLADPNCNTPPWRPRTGGAALAAERTVLPAERCTGSWRRAWRPPPRRTRCW